MEAFVKDPSRRGAVVAEATVTYDQLVSGAAKELINLPAGATVLDVITYVDTAWNSATSDVVIIGDGASTNRFLASVSIAATGSKAMVATAKGYKYAAADSIDAIWTGVGAAPTAGSMRVIVKYYHPTQADFIQE